MPPAPGRQPAEGAHKRGLNSKLHLVADAQGWPVRMGLIPGTRADCPQAVGPRAGREAEDRVADRGYDRDPVGAAAGAQGMIPVIPPSPPSQASPHLCSGAVSVAASGGARLPGFQAMAGRGSPVGPERRCVAGDLPNPGLGAGDSMMLTTSPSSLLGRGRESSVGRLHRRRHPEPRRVDSRPYATAIG